MNGMILAAAGTAAILIVGEWLWQKRILKGEFARKFVHILTATFAAFWPLFISRTNIALLSVIFIIALIVVKELKIFNSIRSIKRVTFGEIWYAVGISACALLFKDNTIYAIAVLHMALADGFAAVVGVGLAKKAKNFYFHKSRKSLAGTATFILISFSLNISYWLYFSHFSLSNSAIYLSPFLYSIICAGILGGVEVISPKGSDNVIIPLLAGVLLWFPTMLVAGTLFF